MTRQTMTDAEFIAAMSQGLPSPGEVLELGNADLVGSGTWTGWDGPADFAPLPEYPAPSDLPPRPVRDDTLIEQLRHQAKRAAAVSVAFDVACFLLGACFALVLGGAL